jgi:hypothetical protein
MDESKGPNAYGKTHLNNLGGRQKKNRRCRTCTLGEVPGGEERGSLEPAAKFS